jgi:hypothetical protein
MDMMDYSVSYLLFLPSGNQNSRGMDQAQSDEPTTGSQCTFPWKPMVLGNEVLD